MRLELRGITASYGDTTVLRDVDLVVPDGSVVALLGPNGAGKTTLLSAASGLLSADHGIVALDRVDITEAGPDARARRGMCHVTEGRSIFPELTVSENLRLFAPRDDPAGAAERSIEAFPRLGQRLEQIAGTMSGGEQQMLAMARAYATGAPLVLLDEPSLGLAPMVVDEIYAFLGQLAADGASLLIVEQYVAKALALADVVYLLNRGRIVFAGEPGELVESDIFDRYLGSSAVPAS